MRKLLVSFLTTFIKPQIVYAHCDIPCGIYDPHQAQLAAKTVLTMVQKIKDLPQNSELITLSI